MKYEKPCVVFVEVDEDIVTLSNVGTESEEDRSDWETMFK